MSFQQALSGLNATSKNLQVIGNNIANTNTFGSKAGRAEFADMFAAANTGIGVNLQTVAQQFSQGNIKTTDNPMDLAINGTGFFQVSDGEGPTGYMRNGQFKVDREGYVVANNGQKLMGYPADADGVIQPGQTSELQLPAGNVAPRPTGQLFLEANFDARLAVTGDPAAPSIDYSDASTYNNATSVTVYDAKGQEVALTYFFQKADTDTWHVFATANGQDLVDPAAPAPIATITFEADGSKVASPASPVVVNVPATTNAVGALTLPVTFDFDITSLTQYGSPFGVTDLNQDGYSAGQMIGVNIEGDGTLMVRYSNGQSRPAGQIALASFRNPQGLQPLGENMWARTQSSGDALSGVPGHGNLGVLQSGALEESNVDLTGELVNMIVAQRVYQANAQTIKTEDQVLQTLLNLR